MGPWVSPTAQSPVSFHCFAHGSLYDVLKKWSAARAKEDREDKEEENKKTSELRASKRKEQEEEERNWRWKREKHKN